MLSRLFGRSWAPLYLQFFVTSRAFATPTVEPRLLPRTTVAGVCTNIANAVSSASSVYFPGSLQYNNDIEHSTASSSQLSTCSVEPGTAGDIGIILRTVGNYSAPFAVKGGGHAYNPNFSSTPGVQIAMTRFNVVTYHSDNATADVGAGLIWDDVYSALESYGVIVAGGRVTGIGVAGFTLGGGYNWKTNQHGPTIDSVVAFELVVPSGQILSVTQTSYPDLFFSLKGGYNNYGVVTKFTYKVVPQGQVWGGSILTLDPNRELGLGLGLDNYTAQLTAAIVQYCQTSTDPKAELLFSYIFTAGSLIMSTILFYDAPTPPPGLFDAILAIPSESNTVKTQSFASLVKSLTSSPATDRAVHNTVPTTGYPAELMTTILSEAIQRGLQATILDPTSILTFSIEPFLPSILTHSSSPSAYPPSRVTAYYPMSIDWYYTNPLVDAAFEANILASTQVIRAKAIALGVSVPPTDPGVSVYGNYANYATPISQIFGSSLPKMQAQKAVWDPNNVMGLTGGWKVT